MTTSIEWTRDADGALGKTWNVSVGCSRVSPGCEHCYAERFVHRGLTPAHKGLTRLGKNGPRWTGELRFLAADRLEQPAHWRKPRRIFVNSVSDLFHEELTDDQICTVFGVMAREQRHTFLVLTKRAKRMAEWFRWAAKRLPYFTGSQHEAGVVQKWPLPNVHLGVSVEDQIRADERIEHLLACPAVVRWLSIEPQLGPVALDPAMLGCVGHLAESFGNPLIHWVVQGGESGPGARVFDVAWARWMRDACAEAGAAYFLKQLGSDPFDSAAACDRSISGMVRFLWPPNGKWNDPADWPADLRVRQLPEVPRV